MRGKYYIYLSEEEHDVVIESLITWKNDLTRQGRYTDAIDDLLVKVLKAPKKRVKVN